MRYRVSWSDNHLSTAVCGYAIYASRRREFRGEKVAMACRDDRVVYVDLPEGRWWIQVLQKFIDCAVEDWRIVERLELNVTGRELTPGPITNGSVGAVDPGSVGVAHLDPPGDDEPLSMTLVIEGEEGYPTHGKLVHQEIQQPRGVMQEMGRVAGTRFPLGDHIPPPAAGAAHHKVERTLMLQRISANGRLGGTAVSTQVLPERMGYYDLALADVDTVSGLVAGFQMPTAADTWDVDPQGGFRLKPIPPQSDVGTYASYGPVGGPGTFASMAHLSPYFQEAFVPTDEHDLGVEQVFILECADSVRRPKVSPVAVSDPFATASVSTLSAIPMMPQAHDTHHDSPHDYGPYYLMRERLAVGHPARPLRFIRWEVRADTVTPIVKPWEPYVPGKWMRGRYVQARLRLFDETGWSQVISGSVSVRARFPMRTYTGQVAWPAGGGTPWPGVPVVLPAHPITGGALFPNQMHVVATAHGLGGVMSVATVTGAGAGAGGFLVMVWGAGGAPQVAADAVNYIVTGY